MSWLPNGALCEAVTTWPDGNTGTCAEYANRRVIDREGRERCVCHRHGHDLETIEDGEEMSRKFAPNPGPNGSSPVVDP